MKLEIDTVPAIYTYIFYWGMMIALALVPFLWEQKTPQMMALSLSLGAVALLLAHSIKRNFKHIKSVSISLSPTEFISGLVIIFGAIAAGIYMAA